MMSPSRKGDIHMHRSTFLFTLVALLLPCVQVQAQSQQTLDRYQPHVYKSGDTTLNYRLMKPANMKAGEKYPLLIFLHGAGERGGENKRQLKYLPEHLASDAMRKKFPCFVLAPQCQNGKQWVEVPWGDKKSTPMAEKPGSMMAAAMAVLEQTIKEQPIDGSRIYLTGLSMGGYGSWELAMRRATLFAAVAPICGGGDERIAKTIAGIPIWAWHGDKDGAVPVERTREMIAALKAAGGKPRFTEVKGGGHNVWSPAYSDKGGVVAWLFEHNRKQRPK